MNVISFKTKLKSMVTKFGLLIFSIWSYIPIIAGILIPMTVTLPIAYFSWELFSIWPGYGLHGYIYISQFEPLRLVILVFTELIVFLIGIFLFLSGLYHLAKGRKNDKTIVKTGLYKYIRHPQNLGIVLFSLPFALYIPGFRDIGIRMGEILSWFLFCFIISIYSNLEECILTKKFPDEYKTYQLQTGFFLPRLRIRKKSSSIKNEFMTCRKRYLYLIILYLFSSSIIFYILTKVVTRLGWYDIITYL
jgi:protein-S-isoprenylcysteine O-methyltransferase Ste14